MGFQEVSAKFTGGEGSEQNVKRLKQTANELQQETYLYCAV